jgi:hypothetical protein
MMCDVSAAPIDVYVICIVWVWVYVDTRTRSLRVFVKKLTSGSRRSPLLLPRSSREKTDSDLCAISRRVNQEMGEHRKNHARVGF